VTVHFSIDSLGQSQCSDSLLWQKIQWHEKRKDAWAKQCIVWAVGSIKYGHKSRLLWEGDTRKYPKKVREIAKQVFGRRAFQKQGLDKAHICEAELCLVMSGWRNNEEVKVVEVNREKFNRKQVYIGV
jgi:hypothetical protein